MPRAQQSDLAARPPHRPPHSPRLRPAIPLPGSPLRGRSLACSLVCGLVLSALLAAGSGCAGPEDESWRLAPRLPHRTTPPPESPPPLAHCNDRTGHQAGALPWLVGGTCLCNPSLGVLADYQSQGAFPGWGVATLQSWYREAGVSTLADHDECNNLCRQGPHLVKGGRCLVPPTPGTLNWEEVVSGRFALPPWDSERVEAHGGPLPRRTTPGLPSPANSTSP